MRKRLRSHEGANAVEFALVLPILVMLLLGIFTGGIALNAWLQINHAAREGVRYAATLPGDADDDEIVTAAEETAWLRDVLLRTHESASGDLNFGDPTVSICASRPAREGSPPSGYWRMTITGSGAYGGDPAVHIATASKVDGQCYSDGLSNDRVQVTAQKEALLQAALFALRPTLRAATVSRYEDLP